MKNIIMFAAGALIGSLATYALVKNKFEKQAQEEIDSVKEVFSRRVKDEADKQVKEEVVKIRNEYNEYNSLTYNYKSHDNEKILDEKYENQDVDCDEPEEPIDRPYVIAPEEAGMVSGYDIITLTHYEGDNILADDCDELVEDIDNVVGEDYVKHFGEYEDDAVYIRNDRLKADYEILKDTRYYEDVVWHPKHAKGII